LEAAVMMYRLPSLLDASLVANRFIGLNCWTMAPDPIENGDGPDRRRGHRVEQLL
jgi:hypothetical protein